MESIRAEPIRIVYFGTPDYAIPALDALDLDDRIRVELVVTQPDRPAGRGRRLTAPPVKVRATELGYAVYQPESLRTDADRLPIAKTDAHVFVVAAFGKVFGRKLLSVPRFGCINLHASLLPDYRGASPISAAILEGSFRTGVTLMQMDTGLDTGPILVQRSLDILSDDTTSSLTSRLAQLGADLLIDSLGDFLLDELPSIAQDDRAASLTRPMVKADGWIDWTYSARDIERKILAMWDWPRAWTTLSGKPIQIHRADRIDHAPGAPVGTVSNSPEGPVVTTGDGGLIIQVAQSAGAKPLSGDMWLEQSGALGERLGLSGVPELPGIPLIRGAER